MTRDVQDKYKFALNNSLDFITIVNRDYVYEIANDSYCKVLKKKEEEIVGRHVSDVWGKRIFKKTLKKYFDECFHGKKIRYIEKFRFGSSERFMLVTYYPYQKDGDTTHALVVSRDVTEQKKTENRLKNFEYRDPLTGLFNRRSLDLILEKEISKAKRSKTEKLRAILFISLEKFARINQTYGHHIGDILLENTGLRIKTTLRNSDYVFRFEGKEMTALLTHFTRSTDVAKVAQKIINNVSIPYRFKGGDIQITCCIGISVYPDDGEERNTLIRNATSAMNEAKKQGKEFVLYNKELHERSLERLQLENDMYKAFGQNQFVLHYQPIVDINGKIQGCEALIRWKHPEKGLVPPMEFIPLAEETGIIVPIGKWTLYGACKQMFKWAATYDIYVSVNLSAREFESRNLVDVIEGVLKNVGDLDPGRLKLEITETESMRNPDETIEKMMDLNRKGVEIIIDDFGIGQSSLSYLKRLPAETLKIDKAFVDDIVDNPEERDYLATIIRMVKSRKKKVLAEGVSTKEQVEILRQLGCDKIQGFYFSRPLTAEKFEECLIAGGILPLDGTPPPPP